MLSGKNRVQWASLINFKDIFLLGENSQMNNFNNAEMSIDEKRAMLCQGMKF